MRRVFRQVLFPRSPHPNNCLKLLTLARDLKRRKAREREGIFVVEGVRAVEELLRSSLVVRGALVAPQLDDAPRGATLQAALAARRIHVERVDHREFSSAADTESPQGVLAIAEMPAHSLHALSISAGARIVVLDAVQDPGNVGTIVRTAAALDAQAVVALPGTVDLWNAKVVRSAMGTHFHLPVLSSTWETLQTFLTERQIPLWGADVSGTPLPHGEVITHALALAVGNEGAGLSEHVRAYASRLVSIPIAPGVESLNVAVATGILLHAVRS